MATTAPIADTTPLPAEESLLPLGQLEPGDSAHIVELYEAGPIDTRLLELGFVPGTAVRMVRRAPLGDPILYELRGCQIGLRRSEAQRILVRRLLHDPV